MSHDSDLLRLYSDDGSQAAFAELVERNIRMVYAAAVRQAGDADSAKDVVQSVFIDLAAKARSLRRHPALVSWLFTSTRYAARNSVRAESRRRRREVEAHTMHELEAPTADADWLRLRPVLDEAICALRERERETILLRYFRGLSFAEIGEAQDVNESAARQCANRALDKLRKALESRGVESTSAALSLALANSGNAAVPVGLSTAVTAAVTAATATGSAVGAAVLPPFVSAMIGTKALIGVGAVLLFGGIGYTMNRATATARPSAVPSTEAPALPAPATVRSTVPPVTNVSRTDSRLSKAAASRPVATTAAREPRPLTDEQESRQAAHREERQAARRAARRLEKIQESAERRLAPLFAAIDTTPEERDRLIELTMSDHEAAIDYAAANARAGHDLTLSPDEYFDAGWLLRQQVRAEIKTLLGEDRYAAFLANDAAGRQAAVVERMQRRLVPANEPLTEQQGQQLAALLRQRNSFVIHDEVIAAAQGFLSPAQLNELRAEQARQRAGVTKPPVQRAIRENLK